MYNELEEIRMEASLGRMEAAFKAVRVMQEKHPELTISDAIALALIASVDDLKGAVQNITAFMEYNK